LGAVVTVIDGDRAMSIKINWLSVYEPLLFADPDEYVRRVKAALEKWGDEREQLNETITLQTRQK
jgi:hypothetical protein